jgi:hypothetical protein
MHSEQRVTKAVQDLKERQFLLPRPLSQVRKQMLMVCGLTAGEVDRIEKGISLGSLNKSAAGFHSLVRTMLSKGYSRDDVKRMLELTEAELSDLLRS